MEKVLNQSSQASIFFGRLTTTEHIIERDKPYVENQIVIVKQFKLKKEKQGFKKELQILKKIKQLELKNNGGFPVIISAKLSNTLGEIMMSYVGKDIFEVFNIEKSLNDQETHQCLNLS